MPRPSKFLHSYLYEVEVAYHEYVRHAKALEHLKKQLKAAETKASACYQRLERAADDPLLQGFLRTLFKDTDRHELCQLIKEEGRDGAQDRSADEAAHRVAGDAREDSGAAGQ